LGALLGRYEFGALSDEERRSFEAHLLGCDACFDELERGSTTVAEMRARSSFYAPLLRRRRSRTAPLRRFLEAPWQAIRPLRLRPWVVAPVLVVIMAVGIVGLQSLIVPLRYARLATFPSEVAEADIVRSPEARDAVNELIQTGAAYFNLGRYDEAERCFKGAFRHEPEDVEAAYLLGLSVVLQRRTTEAIPILEGAHRLATSSPQWQKVAWALANAYLKARRIEEATEILDTLTVGEGEYAARAHELRARLPR
jgi:tetratricopeptide (TPR) repeat protein